MSSLKLPQVPEEYDHAVFKRILHELVKELDNIKARTSWPEYKSLDNRSVASLEEDRPGFVIDPNAISLDIAMKHAGRLHRWTSNTAGAIGSTGGSAPADAQYVVSVADADLPNADVLTQTPNQVLVANGTNTITLSTPQDIATTSTPQFSRLGLGAAADANAPVNAVREDAGTNDVANVALVSRNSTGTPAAGFGNAIEFELETTTTPNTRVGAIDAQHVVATHASRTARLRIVVSDSAGDREIARFESNGSAGLLSFFGGTAVVKRPNLTQTYSTATVTHSNPTASALTDNSGGTANTTVEAMADPADTPLTADILRDDLVANYLASNRNNIADLTAQINALIADVANVKQFVNTLADYLQDFSLCG